MVAQNNHHAAKVIAQFPETALAVRDIVDEALVAAAITEREEPEK